MRIVLDARSISLLDSSPRVYEKTDREIVNYGETKLRKRARALSIRRKLKSCFGHEFRSVLLAR